MLYITPIYWDDLLCCGPNLSGSIRKRTPVTTPRRVAKPHVQFSLSLFVKLCWDNLPIRQPGLLGSCHRSFHSLYLPASTTSSLPLVPTRNSRPQGNIKV